MIRIYRFTSAGALGALIAWAIMEPTSLMPDRVVRISYGQNFAIGLISGLFLGLLLGVADAMSGLSRQDAGKRILLGAAFGAAGGILGLAFGNAVYSAMERIGGPGPYAQGFPGNVPTEALPPSASTPGPISFLLLLFGRGIGWAIFGGLMGLSQGISTASTRKMVNGVVGGIIGGGIGGSIHEILAWMNTAGATSFAPWMVRLIDYLLTGGFIGLLIGCLEELRKQAWLRRLVGRNEGREHSIYKQVTTLGRSEFCDIPVFGDPDVAERHAAISAQGQRHFIEDLGSFFGTAVNGTKITSKQALRDGDTIEIGKAKFLYHDKATARLLPRTPYEPGSQIPTSQHVCPFCGGVKDANGNCDCTVNGGPQQSAPEPQTATQQLSQSTQSMGTRTQPTPAPRASAPAAQAAGPRLVGISGPYSGHTFALKSGQTEIGRDATKDIGLPLDNTVSRNHARIAQEVTLYVVYDAGSTNGTFVNNAKIQRHDLSNGDVIQVGSTQFRFEL